MNRPSLQFAFLWLALPLVFAGCIEGNVRSFVRYDAKDDTFWFLDVYSNLHAAGKADQDYLASLWQRRDNILIKPLNGIQLTADGGYELHLFTLDAIERIGRSQYRLIDLGSPPAKEPKTEDTALRLDTIRVVPGAFYINEFGTLGCYHQMAVPGATVDVVLEKIRPLVAKVLVKLAETEREQAKKGATPASWAEFRKAIVEKLSEDDNPPAQSKAPAQPAANKQSGGLLPLQEASIRLWAAAVAGDAVKLRRAGSVFTVVVPLTKDDAAEAAATYDLIGTTLAARLKAGKKVDAGLVSFHRALKLRATAGEGLEISADLAELARLRAIENPPPDPKKKAYQATIEAVRARGIEIKEKFTIKNLIDEYAK